MTHNTSKTITYDTHKSWVRWWGTVAAQDKTQENMAEKAGAHKVQEVSADSVEP